MTGWWPHAEMTVLSFSQKCGESSPRALRCCAYSPSALLRLRWKKSGNSCHASCWSMLSDSGGGKMLCGLGGAASFAKPESLNDSWSQTLGS